MIMARAKVIFHRDPTLVVGSLRVAFVGPVSAEVPLAKQSTLNESIGSKFCSYKKQVLVMVCWKEQRLPRCSLDDGISLPLFVLECKNGVTISQSSVTVLDSRVKC